MVRHNIQNTADENIQPPEKELIGINADVQRSNRRSKSKENVSGDELIVALSNARENRRARQVYEWENVRRQQLHRAV